MRDASANDSETLCPETKTYLTLIGPVSPAQSTPELFCADPDFLEKINLSQDSSPSPGNSNPSGPDSSPLPDLCLEIARPPEHLSFTTESKVRVIHWTDRGVVYCWEATVTKIGTGNRFVMVRLMPRGLTLQRRRAYRLVASIPFSFTVVDSRKGGLMGRTFSSTTENLSEGGLVFSTSLPLMVGDKLELQLHLPDSERIPSVAWVVRCESPKDPEVTGADSRIGLKFLQLTEEEQLTLLSFLSRAAREPGFSGLQISSDSSSPNILLSPLG